MVHFVGSASALPAGLPWTVRVPRLLALTDVLVIAVGVGAAQVLRLSDEVLTTKTAIGPTTVNYTTLSVVIILVWWLALQTSGCRKPAVLGYGPEEFSRVLTASLWVLALISIASFAFRIGIARGYVAIAWPLATALLLLVRKLWRSWLVRQRRSGQLTTHILAIGPEREIAGLEHHLARNRQAGIVVDAALSPALGPEVDLQSIVEEAERTHVDSILLTASSGLSTAEVRDLLWLLAEQHRDLIISSSLTGISGPRARSRPIAGLPLWQIQAASYQGGLWVIKNILDRLVSAILLVLFSPILLLTACAIRLDSKGPVFYRQERVGANGTTFSMVKFRSMVVGADQLHMTLLTAQGAAGVPLFRLDQDPRITTVGAFIRKHSVDELPQLWNVLKGDMSLVGPRPPLPEEVALYDHVAHHRLKTRPGMTGLWQVSGRSDLDWEEAVLLDLYYVENWSLPLDLALLWRTFSVVLTGKGSR